MKAKLLGVALLPLVMTGCSLFEDSEEDPRQPLELTSITEEVELDRIWDVNIGRGAEDKAIKLVPAFSGSRIFAASADGYVRMQEPV